MKANWGTWVATGLGGLAVVAVVMHFVAAPQHVEAKSPSTELQGKSDASITFPYNINMPNQSMELNEKLGEISDLSLASDNQSMWAVHDEKHKLYRISVKDGAIVEKFDLDHKGDFEGVATVGNGVIVASSEGTLLQVDPRSGKTTEWAHVLDDTCNIEGLAHDSKRERLLMVCKTARGEKGNYHWVIYAMDLSLNEVGKQPAYTITQRALEQYASENKKDLRATEFDPSAITVHPQTGHIYLTSSRGRMIAVLNVDGKLIHAEKLERSVHPQPEGLAFLPDGTLFIASEARNEQPMLHRFALRVPKS